MCICSCVVFRFITPFLGVGFLLLLLLLLLLLTTNSLIAAQNVLILWPILLNKTAVMLKYLIF